MHVRQSVRAMGRYLVWVPWAGRHYSSSYYSYGYDFDPILPYFVPGHLVD